MANPINSLNRPTNPLDHAKKIATAGVEVENFKAQVFAENIANAQTTGTAPGQDPYRRKMVVVKHDRTGAPIIETVTEDKSDFSLEYNPGHPAADPNTGMVKTPNVKSSLERADMLRSKEQIKANLQVVSTLQEQERIIIDMMKQ